MDLMNEAQKLAQKATEALDANGDGQLGADEVFDALKSRTGEVASAAQEAAGAVKEGLDANGDGQVGMDEVVGTAQAVLGAMSELGKNLMGGADAE